MRYLIVLKALLFTVLVPGTVAVYLPCRLVCSTTACWQVPQLILLVPGALLALLAVAMYLRCTWDFAVEGLGTPAPVDPPKKLVTTGLYRWNRNPMFQAVLILLLAECLLSASAMLLLYAAAVATIFQLLVAYYEEPMLARQFGEAYQDYCRQVPRWGFARRAFAAETG